jgi:transcriptional regulator with XRE-family HTH domain
VPIFIEEKSEVGKVILNRLKELDRTQSWLARKTGVTAMHINKICNGDYSNPGVMFFIKASDVLEIPIPQLMDAIKKDKNIL